jgi:hypothetical protein
MRDINQLLEELKKPEPLSYDLINFKKYLDTVKGWIKKIAFYQLVHDFFKHLLTVALNAFDGMFEFSARFKFADLMAVEFTGKLEFPIATTVEFHMANEK